MSLRQKLLLTLALTVTAAVAIVAVTVSYRVRSVFQGLDKEQTAAFVAQFRREFQRRADEVALSLDRLAKSESVTRTAFDITHGGDAAVYVTEAANLAQEYQLDFLEIVGPDGNIVSSAQWPARFGYKEPEAANGNHAPFLKQEALPDGTSQSGLFVTRTARGTEQPVVLLGGKKLDKDFLSELSTPAGSQVFLYQNAGTGFVPQSLIGVNGEVSDALRYRGVVDRARSSAQEQSAILYLTAKREDSVNVTAIPLKAEDGAVLAVLLVTNSRRRMVEVQQHIKAISYGVAGFGILISIAASLWIATRVSRPIEQLAEAAEEVAAGHWDTRVYVHSRDEIGVLAESFNRMTSELIDQRERLVQSERVAAWRELARRLAHELKNPLFPLQLTVENMLRARQLPQQEFDEVFDESTSTLMAEIGNLKGIIGRFSDFSKMPKPQEEPLEVTEALERVVSLYSPMLAERDHPINLKTEMLSTSVTISADPELLHRALSNLVLNAIDAMPEGGTLTIATAEKKESVQIKISDTGTGMNPEECQRLFTPYYTTKEHGTGLGLAIVQSVISDHRGSISVSSVPGQGTTFTIDLPKIDFAISAEARA